MGEAHSGQTKRTRRPIVARIMFHLLAVGLPAVAAELLVSHHSSISRA